MNTNPATLLRVCWPTVAQQAAKADLAGPDAFGVRAFERDPAQATVLANSEETQTGSAAADLQRAVTSA